MMNRYTLAEFKNEKNMLFFIVVLGLLVRLYAFKFTYIINNDGVYYINQARAIYQGNWELAKQCGYDFISIYHLLIPLFYRIFGDWVIAAKSISLLFGTLIIIPCYFILKKFLHYSTALITCLAFSINPFFVLYSVEVIKGPISWFFALLGISLFISALYRTEKSYILLLSSLSFLCACFARFEMLFYFIGSALYILSFKKGRLKNLFFFNLPIIVLGTVVLFGLLAHQEGFKLWSVYFEPRIYRFFDNVYESVLNVGIFKKSAFAFWLIVYKTIGTLYLPMLPFLIAGLLTLKQKLNKNSNLWYLIILSLLSFLVLYLFYLKMEVISSRYTLLIIFPTFVLIGFGIEQTMSFLKTKGLNERTIIWSICIYIIIFCLPYNLIHKRTEKLIYKDIGSYISRAEDNKKVEVMASDERITFYANLYARDIACANLFGNYEPLIRLGYTELLSQLKEKNFKYFIWDKKSWENAQYNFLTTAKPEHFKEKLSLNTKDNTFIVYEIVN